MTRVLARIPLRAVVVRFAEQMELRLLANDHKPGWQDEEYFDLVGRVRGELLELEDAIHDLRSMERLDPDKIGKRKYDHNMKKLRAIVVEEAADVANFCMMIADVAGKEYLHGGPK
jgi:NTP pyrophosphatase (non-canonical NTP hydrolase)